MPTQSTADNEHLTLRSKLKESRRIVVKVGTRVLVNEKGRPHRSHIARLANDLSHLQKQGYDIILVSSGAIATALPILKMTTRPTAIADLQMAAAVGQSHLLDMYHHYFAKNKVLISQILLTHDDIKNRQRHLNARNTLLNLLKHNILPIINENDAVSVDEIKIGDNDHLSALVSCLIDADLLIMLTTPDGLLTGITKNAKRIPWVKKIDSSTYQYVSKSTEQLSTGGMVSKINSAHLAIKSGAQVVIARGHQARVVTRILQGKDIGTLFSKGITSTHLNKRKRWISYFHKSQGKLIIDEGALKALTKKQTSLLPVGITDIQGNFKTGSLVDIVYNNKTVGHGLVSFGSQTLQQIIGLPTRELTKKLNDKSVTTAIHRDNMVLFQ